MTIFDPSTWFDDIKSYFGFSGPSDRMSWWQYFWTSIFPFGQLYARIMYYNGSLDKLLLLFFAIPPVSFIPMLLIKFGYIKEGKGASVKDDLMYIPIFSSLVFPLLVKVLFRKLDMEDSTILEALLNALLIIGVIFFINIYRRSISCTYNTDSKDNNVDSPEEAGITFDSIGKAGMDSVIEYAVSILIPVILTFIPVIGEFIGMAMDAPIIGSVVYTAIWSMGFVTTYVVYNMFNQDDIKRYCKTPFSGNFLDQVFFWLSVFVIIGLAFLNDM